MLKDFLMPRDTIKKQYKEFKSRFPLAHSMFSIMVSTNSKSIEFATLFSGTNNDDANDIVEDDADDIVEEQPDSESDDDDSERSSNEEDSGHGKKEAHPCVELGLMERTILE